MITRRKFACWGMAVGLIGGCSKPVTRSGTLIVADELGSPTEPGEPIELFAVAGSTITPDRVSGVQRALPALIEADRNLTRITHDLLLVEEEFSTVNLRRSNGGPRPLGDPVFQQAASLHGKREELTRAKNAALESWHREHTTFGDAWKLLTAAAGQRAKAEPDGTFRITMRPRDGLCAQVRRVRGFSVQYFVWIVRPEDLPASDPIVLDARNVLAS